MVFLTACDLEADVMMGFDLGADDYITKPFNINIFRKKVAAVLKRSKKAEYIGQDAKVLIVAVNTIE